MKNKSLIKEFSREYSVQYCEVAIQTLGPKASDHINFDLRKEIFFVPEGDNEACYMSKKAKVVFFDGIVNKYGEIDSIKNFAEAFIYTGRKYLDYSKEISKRDLSKKSNRNLKEIYLEYQKRLIEYSLVGGFVGYILSIHWSTKGDKLTSGLDQEIKDELFRPLEKNTILKMQSEAKNIDINNNTEVKAFWDKYQWLPCLDIHKVPWELNDAKNFIADSKEIVSRNTKLNFTQALKKSGLEEHKDELEAIKYFGYVRDARDDFRRKGVFNAKVLFGEIAKRSSLSIKEIAYFTQDEIVDFLGGAKLKKSISARRKNGFVLKFYRGRIVCVDNNIDAEVKKLGLQKPKNLSKIVKGMTASRGKANGRVVIIQTIHDIIKVEKGDILVAVSTHPDYVIAMRKASAIVTDEGGVLSHAAIVSRELGIPCVVGTKNATKVFKSGDRVIVDASNGTIKLIN